DPMGVVTRWKNDAAGRRVRLVENAGAASCDDGPCAVPGERVTLYAYNADGLLERLTLVNGDTGNQVTRWVYGTTTDDSEVARTDLLRAKIYPASDDEAVPAGDGYDDSYQRIEYTYNRQGQKLTMKDP